jgi:hypothetical protein
MKIRIASAVTKPVITERETKRINAAESEPAGDDLQRAGEYRGGEQVLQAVVLDQRHHQQRHGARSSRNHAWATAGEGHHRGDAERGVQPDPGVCAGNDREGNRFGNQCQRDRQAGEQIIPDVGKSVLMWGFHCFPVALLVPVTALALAG